MAPQSSWHDVCPSVLDLSITFRLHHFIFEFCFGKKEHPVLHILSWALMGRNSTKMKWATKNLTQNPVKTNVGKIQMKNSLPAERVNSRREEKIVQFRLSMCWGLSSEVDDALGEQLRCRAFSLHHYCSPSSSSSNTHTQTHTYMPVNAHMIMYAHTQIHTALINMQKLWLLHRCFCITAF